MAIDLRYRRSQQEGWTVPAPTVRLGRLAAELRQSRKVAELTREEVSERTGVNVATLYRIETARARPQTRTLAALLGVYGLGKPKRTEMMTLLKQSAHRGRLNTFAADLPERYTSYIDAPV